MTKPLSPTLPSAHGRLAMSSAPSVRTRPDESVRVHPIGRNVSNGTPAPRFLVGVMAPDPTSVEISPPGS